MRLGRYLLAARIKKKKRTRIRATIRLACKVPNLHNPRLAQAEPHLVTRHSSQRLVAWVCIVVIRARTDLMRTEPKNGPVPVFSKLPITDAMTISRTQNQMRSKYAQCQACISWVKPLLLKFDHGPNTSSTLWWHFTNSRMFRVSLE